QERDVDVEACCLEQGEARRAVKRWVEFQDGQRILVTTPSVLVGYRVQVYRAEGTTQWYTAVIISYNETTRRETLSTSPENASQPVLGGELAARRRCPRGVALALSRAGERRKLPRRRSRMTRQDRFKAGRAVVPDGGGWPLPPPSGRKES
ncbi:unnamed protein product, partial [Ixodes pacificus]